MTELFASEKTQERYKRVIAAAMPHLQGYDEVHLLTEEDFEKLAPQKNESDIKREDIVPLMRGGELFNKFQENNDGDQALAAERIFRSMSFGLSRARTGPVSLTVQTSDENQTGDYKVGFVFLNKFDPKVLVKDYGFSGLHQGEEAEGMLGDFVLAHELGHLADGLEKGIPKMGMEMKRRDLILKRHGQEVAADGFAHDIISHVHGDHGHVGKLDSAIMNGRSMTGVWSLAISKPDEHFTAPFLNGGELQDIPFSTVLRAGEVISGGVDQRTMQAMRNALDQRGGKEVGAPSPDMECLDKAFERREKDNRSQLAYSMFVKKGDPFEKDSLFDTFKDCSSRQMDFRTRILSSMRYDFDQGTPERRILDHYMTVVSRIAEEGSNPATAQPVVFSNALKTPNPAAP